MTRLEKAIEEIKAMRKLPKNVRPWIYDDNGNIREDVICGDIIPFLEEIKPYEINVSDKWVDDFIENEATQGDNTYNWDANIDSHINLWWRKGNPIVVMMVHLLGDIRGNYTDKFAIKVEGRGEAIDEIFYQNDSRMQYKNINDRYSADIDIFRNTYDVYDNEKGETIGEYYEIEVEDLLKEIEKMNGNYYKVKLNDGNTYVLFENDEVLEKMVAEGIIKEYTHALDNFSTEKAIDNYIFYYLKNAVSEICLHIQNVKEIDNGDCPPELSIKMDSAIGNMRNAIKEIIAYQEEMNNVDNK